jgi:hypothetical protein
MKSLMMKKPARPKKTKGRRWTTMTTKLKSRIAGLERGLPARRQVKAPTGPPPPDFDAEEYGRFLRVLRNSMPAHYSQRVVDEMSRMLHRDDILQLAVREAPFHLRPSRRALVPRVRPSCLTLSFLGRADRAGRGDGRPVALPARVCDVYHWAETYKRDDIPVRECEDCGYDTPAPRPMTITPCLHVMEGIYIPSESYAPIVITSCPFCGGTLAPEHHRPWSDRNRDKVVDVHVWPDGKVSVM